MKEAAVQTPDEEEGEGHAQHQSRDFLIAHGAALGGAVGCPAAHRGSWCSKYSPAAHEEPPSGGGRSPNEAVALRETCTAAVFWQLQNHGERSPHWSRFVDRTCDPVRDPHGSHVYLNDCIPWEGSKLLEQLMKNCISWEALMLKGCHLWKGSYAGKGKESEESFPRE